MKKNPIYKTAHTAGILDIVEGAMYLVLVLTTVLYLISGRWITDRGNGDVASAVGVGVLIFICLIVVGWYCVAELIAGILYLVSGRRFLRLSFGDFAPPFSVAEKMALPYFLTAVPATVLALVFHWLISVGIVMTLVYMAITKWWDNLALWELGLHK